jgi:hypothetical protein
MKRIPAILLVLALLSACASTGGKGQRPNASRQLAQAVALLDKGDAAGATRLLSAVCSEPPEPHVTDEALFRLALLTLKPAPERSASARGPQLLKRLKREYPGSPWTVQAAPLMELIDQAEELRHQNRNLKAANQSLKGESGEQSRKIEQLNKKIDQLNHNIEQLKHLDLELEQKRR